MSKKASDFFLLDQDVVPYLIWNVSSPFSVSLYTVMIMHTHNTQKMLNSYLLAKVDTLAICTGTTFRSLWTGLCCSITFMSRSLDTVISLVLCGFVTEILNSYLKTAVTVSVR